MPPAGAVGVSGGLTVSVGGRVAARCREKVERGEALPQADVRGEALGAAGEAVGLVDTPCVADALALGLLSLLAAARALAVASWGLGVRVGSGEADLVTACTLLVGVGAREGVEKKVEGRGLGDGERRAVRVAVPARGLREGAMLRESVGRALAEDP